MSTIPSIARHPRHAPLLSTGLALATLWSPIAGARTSPAHAVPAAPATAVAAVAPSTPPTAVAPSAPAIAPALAAPAGPKVLVSGTVPDEATRAAILARVRELYGAERVVDQLGVGPLAAPPQWGQQVQKLLGPDLKRVSQGQLRVEGSAIELAGVVESEPAREQLIKGLRTRLEHPGYALRDGLRVSGIGQQALDQAMANRVVEFEFGNATLTPTGQRVLDDLLPVLQRLVGRRFEIVGHTDAEGSRAHNLVLSAARAEAVKAYLIQRGIPAAALVTAGLGPDRPVADNATAEGRARNRRIEFRLLA